MRTTPGGIGPYIRAIETKVHGGPEWAAEKAEVAGASFVPIMGAWQQPRKDRGGKVVVGSPNKRRLEKYVAAFHKRGIRVGLWFYPWAGHEEELVGALREQCEIAPIDFLLNDSELGFKWKKGRKIPRSTMRGAAQGEAIEADAPRGGKAWVTARARELVEGIDALVEAYAMEWGHWFTAYGIPRFHPTFPWEVFAKAADVLSPQLYTSTAKQIDDGIAEWYAHAGVVPGKDPLPFMIPSVPTYGPNSGENLDEYLLEFVNGAEETDGFAAWSWRQTSRREWAILGKWARLIDRGAFALPPT